MVVRLSDAVIPVVYDSYGTLNDVATNAFISSGIMVRNEVMDTIARQGSSVATMPFWKDLDQNAEPNYSNDDPADLAVALKVGSGKMVARKAWLNQGWGTMDLVQELAGSDPMKRIKARTNNYWTGQLQKRAIATLVGVMADNIANDTSDMVIDISAVGDGIITSDAFVDAAYTMGDRAESLTAIAVHSTVMARWVKQSELVYLPDSEGIMSIPTYKGKRVVVDDGMPVLSGTGANRVFLSVLFGTGAFGFGGVDGHAFAMGEGVPANPSEVSRVAQAGSGGGMEELWERKTWIVHPGGFEWVESGAALVEMSPTLADLRLAAHWNRVVDRKQVPIAFIKSKA